MPLQTMSTQQPKKCDACDGNCVVDTPVGLVKCRHCNGIGFNPPSPKSNPPDSREVEAEELILQFTHAFRFQSDAAFHASCIAIRKAFARITELEAALKEAEWMKGELASIGKAYCGVNVNDPNEVQDGLTHGLIYAMLEGAFLKAEESSTQRIATLEAENSRLTTACEKEFASVQELSAKVTKLGAENARLREEREGWKKGHAAQVESVQWHTNAIRQWEESNKILASKNTTLTADNQRMREAISDALKVDIRLPYGLREQFEKALTSTSQHLSA